MNVVLFIIIYLSNWSHTLTAGHLSSISRETGGGARERNKERKSTDQQWQHAKLNCNEFPDSSSQNVIMIEVVKRTLRRR